MSESATGLVGGAFREDWGEHDHPSSYVLLLFSQTFSLAVELLKYLLGPYSQKHRYCSHGPAGMATHVPAGMPPMCLLVWDW